MMLNSFANFNSIKLDPPISISKLLKLGIEMPESGYGESKARTDEIIAYSLKTFGRNSEMLKTYFMFDIEGINFL